MYEPNRLTKTSPARRNKMVPGGKSQKHLWSGEVRGGRQPPPTGPGRKSAKISEENRLTKTFKGSIKQPKQTD